MGERTKAKKQAATVPHVDELAAAKERIAKLEGQRQLWWRRAWYMHAVLLDYDREKAEDVVEGWDREEPSR